MDRYWVELSGGRLEVLEWPAGASAGDTAGGGVLAQPAGDSVGAAAGDTAGGGALAQPAGDSADNTAGDRASGGVLALLHEGLGSAGLWRDFPARLAHVTGRRVVAWSRFGYGWSSPAGEPRGPSYMHYEALTVLPELAEVLGLAKPTLVGHSDGASIALIYAGGGNPVEAIVALAPHVIVEDRSIAGIRAAKERFESTDLADRMAKHHADPEATFRGWNDAWLAASFRDWDIRPYLPGISVPVLAVQCRDDEYGTLDQLDLVRVGVAGYFQQLVFQTGGHAPHASHAEEVATAIARFLEGLS
ncbi:MAG: alpha/beta fold hydrolase [Acidimicrobiales bacterium]